MNAPPGVDTDTSGEEFTPPPSLKAESPKAEFSLTSILPTTQLKKLRKPKSDIKTQTPEEASEVAKDPRPDRTRNRLAKKRVRIVDNIGEPDDTPVTSQPEEIPEKPVEEAIVGLPPVSMADRDPGQVIALLRQMMAKNTQEDDGDDEDTDRIEPSTLVTTKLVDDIEPSSSDDVQLPTPIGPTFAKRRPGGLDFSSLFKSKTKSKPAIVSATASQLDHLASQTDLSISTGTSDSNSPPNIAEPPKSAPPWLWTGPGPGDPGPPPQPYPIAPPSAMSPSSSGYPPWLWAGPSPRQGDHQYARQTQPAPGYADRGQNTAYAAHPHPAYPPFPPYYPHPQSLQPWQPYYPPWTAPLQHHGSQMPYDGIGETSSAVLDTGELAGMPASQASGPPRRPTDLAEKSLSKSAQPEDQTSWANLDEPKIRPPAVQVSKPVPTDVRSIAESQVPERGERGVKPSKHNARDAPSKHHGHIEKALRTVGIIPPSRKADTVDVNDGEPARSTSCRGPTLTECLLSLTTCIHLGQKLLRHMEADKGASGQSGGHGQFYRLLTKVMASLLTQRNMVEGMTKLVGNGHADEISHFAQEVETINKFFRSSLHKRHHSKKDTKRLSDLHGQATRNLEAGGLTGLLGQVFTLTDFLTPIVIQTVTDLLRQWADDQLTAKSVMKALMLIQHEVAKVHQQQEGSGATSKEGDAGVWTLLKYVDLLYGLFASDNDVDPARPHDTIPGSWPANPVLSRKASQSGLIPQAIRGEHTARSRKDTPDDKHHGKSGVTSLPTERQPSLENSSSLSHRSPRQVVSDFVHLKRNDTRDAKVDLPSQTSVSSSTISGSDRNPKLRKVAESAINQAPQAAPLPNIKVKTYRTAPSSRSSDKPPVASLSHKVRSTTPTTPLLESPQSSPSQYSQDEDDIPSEGTLSSDEDAKSLLAQADSGPKRVAPLNIRKKSNGLDQEQVQRAKKVMTG